MKKHKECINFFIQSSFFAHQENEYYIVAGFSLGNRSVLTEE